MAAELIKRIKLAEKKEAEKAATQPREETDFEKDVKKVKETLDMPVIERELRLMKGERDVMELLSTTWVANRGLGSMKKTFAMTTQAAASKTATLDGSQ